MVSAAFPPMAGRPATKSRGPSLTTSADFPIIHSMVSQQSPSSRRTPGSLIDQVFFFFFFTSYRAGYLDQRILHRWDGGLALAAFLFPRRAFGKKRPEKDCSAALGRFPPSREWHQAGKIKPLLCACKKVSIFHCERAVPDICFLFFFSLLAPPLFPQFPPSSHL